METGNWLIITYLIFWLVPVFFLFWQTVKIKQLERRLAQLDPKLLDLTVDQKTKESH